MVLRSIMHYEFKIQIRYWLEFVTTSVVVVDVLFVVSTFNVRHANVAASNVVLAFLGLPTTFSFWCTGRCLSRKPIVVTFTTCSLLYNMFFISSYFSPGHLSPPNHSYIVVSYSILRRRVETNNLQLFI